MSQPEPLEILYSIQGEIHNQAQFDEYVERMKRTAPLDSPADDELLELRGYPEYLTQSLQDYIEDDATGGRLWDCVSPDPESSINMAERDDDITPDAAEFLRRLSLGMRDSDLF